jgi:hypothetical protein
MSSAKDHDPLGDCGCTLTLLVDLGANQAFRNLCELSPRARQPRRARVRREDLVAGTIQRLQQVQEG